MKNIQPNMRRGALFLLACLTFAPAAPLLSAPAALAAQVEPRLSEKLNSPLRNDVKHTANYWLKHYSFVSVDAKDEEKAAADIHRTLLPIMLYGEPQKPSRSPSRLDLLDSLQILNIQGKRSVLEGIDRTITQAGKNSLFNLAAQETTNWNVVKARQQFIATLIENPNTLAEIQASLRTIKNNEALFAKAIKKAGSIVDALATARKNVQKPEELIAILFLTFLKKLVDNYDFLKNTAHFAANATAAGVMVTTGITAVAGTAVLFCKKYLPDAIKENINTSKGVWATIATIITTSCLSYGSYRALKKFKNEHAEWFFMAQGTAQVCRGALHMHEQLCNKEDLKRLYPELFTQESSSWNNLLNRLEKSTFNAHAKPTLFFTHHGRVDNTVRMINETKNELGILMRFYGELDAYQSMAQFYLDHQATENTFGEKVHCCLVDFIDDSHQSILHAQNLWHPIIPADRVRPSTLLLGSEDKPRNLVVTGPNAGGKSVNLKALLVNLILAQTFGIACAESFEFTPFKKIIARLSSVDDTASDDSKFMLEAKGMARLLKEMMELNPQDHAFVVTDEIFTGTEVGPAISLSIELCAQIAQLKNVMYVLATHFKEITEVKYASNNVFDNYKVSVSKDPETGKLIYPYSLTPGVGNTNVAFDIFLEQLQAQGINDPVLINVIEKAKQRQEAIEAKLNEAALTRQLTPATAATA